MPDDVVGPELSERCNIIFWTVYILDREFSALMGGPMSVRDEDITTDLPSQKNNSTTAINMTLQIRLSRLTAQILTSKSTFEVFKTISNQFQAVYGVGKEFDGALLRNTQSILYILADLSRDLSHTFSAQFQGSISQISRTTTRLMLSYHHVSIPESLYDQANVLLVRRLNYKTISNVCFTKASCINSTSTSKQSLFITCSVFVASFVCRFCIEHFENTAYFARGRFIGYVVS